MSEELDAIPPPEEPPPVLGRWRNVYMVVLGELVIIVILFALLKSFAS